MLAAGTVRRHALHQCPRIEETVGGHSRRHPLSRARILVRLEWCVSCTGADVASLAFQYTRHVDDSTISSASLGRRAELAGPVGLELVVVALCDDPGFSSSRHRLVDVDEVHFGRGSQRWARTKVDGLRVLRIELPDQRMSSNHGRMMRGPAGWAFDDPSSKNGSIVNGEVTRHAMLESGTVLELGRAFVLLETSAHSRVDDPPDVVEATLDPPEPTLATFSGSLSERFRALAAVARTSISVIIRGATGTGKEVAARALHKLSGREGAFIAVNCGALPATLVEAELFGHRRGAFTGAMSDRPGLIRAASGGTLFLDEIGELPAASQAALLRVLQEHEVLPIGDDRPVKVDLRLCVATHRDLQQLVELGQFREDLYARIAGFTLVLPPLRERRVDFGLLLRTLLARIPTAKHLKFTPAAMRMLLNHHWRLNVRELEKVLITVSAITEGGCVDASHLSDLLLPARVSEAPSHDAKSRLRLSAQDQALRDQLIGLLKVHNGNIVAVSRAIGARRTQIYRWAERLEIDLVALDPPVDLHPGLAHRPGDIGDPAAMLGEECEQVGLALLVVDVALRPLGIGRA